MVGLVVQTISNVVFITLYGYTSGLQKTMLVKHTSDACHRKWMDGFSNEADRAGCQCIKGGSEY